MNIKILDCTLRDGGYVNNWRFGSKCISSIISGLAAAGVELTECGFLSRTRQADRDSSIFSLPSEIDELVPRDIRGLAMMINCGEYAPEDIPEYKGGAADTVRIAFHKEEQQQALELFRAARAGGYRCFFQPMVTSSYSDTELLRLIDRANECPPEAFYMVDSFGTMRKKDVLRIFSLLDNNLAPQIQIGFHSHNNLQLSFSNAQELIAARPDRDIIIDTSVLGMGRGAGNLCTELMTRYINENIQQRYDIIPILEIMDEYIMPIYSSHPWGYSAPYYIAAVNDCHPNYAGYLVSRQTLSIGDINRIVGSIPEDKKHIFDRELINSLYLEYQSRSVDDREAIKEIGELCRGRAVLVTAPGRSVLTCREDIAGYIDRENPVVIAINHIPEYHSCDRIFISNLKRFRGLGEAVEDIRRKLIVTSNINAGEGICTVDYSAYLAQSEVIYDNAGVMLINILKRAGVKSVALAGYDGFDYADARNYFDEALANNIDAGRQAQTNEAMTRFIAEARRDMEIRFITPSMYDKEDA